MDEKQSSGYGHNKAEKSIIRSNTMFNVPQTTIAFSCGMGGVDIIEGNLIWNTRRESSDHGSINTWERS